MTKDELKNFEFVHEPAANNCIGCHSGHGANNSQMLKSEAPGLCYPCHEDIKKIAESSKHPHTVVTEAGGCLKCHTPHASTIRYGLKDTPSALCEACHDKPIQMDEDKVIESFTAEVKNKKFLHGPVGQKDCKGCHTGHGSGHFRLLVEEYPPQFYAPFKKENYALCFSCHPETVVLTKETTDLTDFRNGNVNLHFLHVNKEQRGRTCRSCHATHASNLPKHIRKSVPYGMWDLPIGFKKTDTHMHMTALHR
jgi:predicted CXXCH cytochrome family protein